MKNKPYLICCGIILLCITICCGAMQKKPINVYAEFTQKQTAKSAILIDYDSKSILYEKDINCKLPIASMVKLMTIYLTFKNIDSGNLSYDKKITTSETPPTVPSPAPSPRETDFTISPTPNTVTAASGAA